MSTVQERYAAFQQANLAAQQAALKTGEQQQINYSKDASGSVTYSYSPTGTPASSPTGSPPSPIGVYVGGGGSQKSVIQVGNEQEQRQKDQARQRGLERGLESAERMRQQFQDSRDREQARMMAQQTITVQRPPEVKDFDPYKNASWDFDEAGRVRNVRIDPQEDIGFFGRGTVTIEEKDGEQYGLYTPTEEEAHLLSNLFVSNQQQCRSAGKNCRRSARG
jgi:hypothetical protein